MKRDWELVRAILAKVEETESTQSTVNPNEFLGYSEELVSYHIYILEQSGLIEATCSKSLNNPMFCLARSITWNGHEFLDKIRNDTIWKKIKAKASEKSIDLSFDTIKSIATAILTQVL